MTISELNQALSSKTFYGDRSSALTYRFDAQTMKLNNSYLAKWDLYQEESNIYMRTEPSLKGEDFLIQITNEGFPLTLHLSNRHTGNQFITLTEVES